MLFPVSQDGHPEISRLQPLSHSRQQISESALQRNEKTQLQRPDKGASGLAND